LISDVLDNWPQTYTPGTTYYYLNFGSCVLGRMIEKVTGQSYDSWVSENILAPVGISAMKIGVNTLDERLNNEVVYYDQEGFSPYIMNVNRMDSHGGWIASAEDIVKFLISVDRNGDQPDLVSSSSLNNLYFGFRNWTFYGSLPGTSSVISRMNDVYGFSIITNTRTIPTVNILDEMNNTVNNHINSINIWPDYDLFDRIK